MGKVFSLDAARQRKQDQKRQAKENARKRHPAYQAWQNKHKDDK